MTEVGARFGTLTVTVAGGTPVEHALDLPTLVVGRAEGSAILVDDLSIARRHARLSIESGRLMVEDLGSATGTFIGGHQIPPHVQSLVEGDEEIRFGEVSARYAAPAEIAAAAEEAAEVAAEMPATIRATLTPPVEPIMPGGSPGLAYLTVQNRGRVVDQLAVTVQNVPAEWVHVSTPNLVLVPGDQQQVSIVIQPPRRPESSAGTYDFSVVVSSAETNREVLVSGSASVLAFEDTSLALRPVRSKKKFELVAENRGNAVMGYALSGRDDEDAFQYEFPDPSLVLQPGEKRVQPFRVKGKRKLFGRMEMLPFTVAATATSDSAVQRTALGQLLVKPPLQPFVFPTFVMLVIAAAVLGALAYFFWPVWPFEESAEAKLEEAYAGVHMCDKDDAPPPTAAAAPGSQGGTASETPLFAQNNSLWSDQEYARAKDPEFGPDWCGDTIEQCGCAMTSVTTVMALFQLLTMPDGEELTPQSVNEWFNGDAQKTNRGWVSRGYVYGDVIWTSVNQLSGEIARLNPGAPMIRFSRTGTGSDEEVRAELTAGRPIILEVPGHWIAAVGINAETGQVLINDPYYRDRKTLDYYQDKGLVLSSVLFESTNDLSAVVITVPRDVRVRVTDKDGRVVGTLNEAPAAEAAAEAQIGITGASYSSRRAWRDPTCVESPPPLEAGTNQSILPGSADDYTIEVVATTDAAASVAIHSYDKNGVPTITIEEAPAAPIQLSYDPDKANATVTVVPAPTPTPAEGDGSGGDGGSGDGEGAGAGGATETPEPATETPTETGTPTEVPTATPTPPVPPSNVAITCKTEYKGPPPLATVECTGTVDGTFTSSNWAVNGVAAAADGLAMSVTFSKDTTLTVQLTACNVTACQSSTSAVKVEFPPPGSTPTPTNTPVGTTPTATPASQVQNASIDCSVDYVPDVKAVIDCIANFTGQFTSITWTAPGANPAALTTGGKTFTTEVPNNGDTSITIGAEICNFSECTVVQSKVVPVTPKSSTLMTLEYSTPSCTPLGDTVTLYAFVSGPQTLQTEIETGKVQFFLGGSPFGGPVSFDGEGWSTQFNWTSETTAGATFLGTTHTATSSKTVTVFCD